MLPAYQVFFDQEKYMFRPDANDKSLLGFSFKREHDEWHDQEPLAPQLKKQAIDALENTCLLNIRVKIAMQRKLLSTF